jgi:cytochrome b
MNIQHTVKVWDPVVRLFHWSLVIGFTVAYLSGEDESALHINAGYVVLGLILFRLVWGFVGTKHARFADFIYRPSTVIDYTRDLLARRPQHYYGHNPLGGLMVIALLLGLLGTSVSGLALYAVKENAGPLAGIVVANTAPSADFLLRTAQADEDRHEGEKHRAGTESAAEETWEEVHEVLANFTLTLVFLHIAGVILGSIVHRENLVRAMITGRKPAPRD